MSRCVRHVRTQVTAYNYLNKEQWHDQNVLQASVTAFLIMGQHRTPIKFNYTE